MSTANLVIYVTLAIAVYWVGKVYSFWTMSFNVKKVHTSLARDKKVLKKQKRVLRVLRWLSDLNAKFGRMSEYEAKDLSYRILRLRMKIKRINRLVNPDELNGLFIAITLLGITIILFGIATLNVFILVLGGVLLFAKKIFITYADLMISDGDYELTVAFPDFYLFMYSRLKLGVNTRLLPTLNEYSRSLEDIYGEDVDSYSIYRFVENFKQYINIYSDEVIALKKLREMYRCAVVINFINIAIQSLQGVDNIDKLQSFKTELKMTNIAYMEKKLSKAKEKGMRLIYVVFFILGQFVVATWVSKIDVTMFSGLLK